MTSASGESGRPSAARRRERLGVPAGGRSPSVTEPRDSTSRSGSARSSGEAALHRGRVCLAAERRPQLLEVVLGLVQERPRGLPHRRPGRGDLGVVVVVELDDHPVGPGKRRQDVLGVGGHQVGEVRRAERRRQAQVHDDVGARRAAVHLERPDEAEVGDRLVELGVDHVPSAAYADSRRLVADAVATLISTAPARSAREAGAARWRLLGLERMNSSGTRGRTSSRRSGRGSSSSARS